MFVQPQIAMQPMMFTIALISTLSSRKKNELTQGSKPESMRRLRKKVGVTEQKHWWFLQDKTALISGFTSVVKISSETRYSRLWRAVTKEPVPILGIASIPVARGQRG